MKSNFSRILLQIALVALSACASKKDKVDVGEVFKHDTDPCGFVPATSKITVEYKDFTGESWPEKARTHSWETAIAQAMSNCHSGGYRVCKHDLAKDTKEPTGKESGPGKFYYLARVVGEKIKEDVRSTEDMKRDDCDALRRCLKRQESENTDAAKIKEMKDRITTQCQ